jgi:hypothetical protein
MSEQPQTVFQRVGRLDTCVVGIQYHDGADAAQGKEVVLELDPDNPVDPNAVAVRTTTGTMAGHLPRYDAEYFSPLIREGIVALRGRAGELHHRRDLLPLALEVFVTPRISAVLERDPGDDWRAIYHNQFADLWRHLPDYGHAALEEFRERFRPLAHDEPLLPKTQFLYRMLKAHIQDLKNVERERLREQLIASVGEIRFGTPMGWGGFAVIPLDATEQEEQSGSPEPADDSSSLPVLVDGDQAALRLLPLRCPYPRGAKGLVVVLKGEWRSLIWFEAPELAEVNWFQTITAALALARSGGPSVPETAPQPAAVREAILDCLRTANCDRPGTEEADGTTRLDISGDDVSGQAVYCDGSLSALRLRAQGNVGRIDD